MNLQIGFDSNMEGLNAKLDKAIEMLQFSNVKGNIHVSFNVYEIPSDLGQAPILATATEVIDAPVEAPKKEKKAKAPKQEVVKEEEPKKEEIKEAAEIKYTRDDVTAAAQKLSEAKSMNEVRTQLGKFKNAAGEACRRLSDIQESDFAMFIKACDEGAL